MKESSEEDNESKKLRQAFNDLKLTGQEVSIENEKLKFAPGDLFKGSAAPNPTICFEGMATLYLNADGQIRRFELDYTENRKANWLNIKKKRTNHSNKSSSRKEANGL